MIKEKYKTSVLIFKRAVEAHLSNNFQIEENGTITKNI